MSCIIILPGSSEHLHQRKAISTHSLTFSFFKSLEMQPGKVKRILAH